MLTWRRPVALVNARVHTPEGEARSIRFDRRILALDAPPRRGDVVVDLDGAFVLPGLINAHDHLELNHYGPLRPRSCYENAADWIDDLRPVIRSAGDVRRNASYPLSARLCAGALKNVLSGVTTVAHHNPRYREIGGRFPLRVVERYGWAHSFALEREPAGANGELGGGIGQRYSATPADAPFIVHLGEGTDAVAAGELALLDGMGCLRSNTVLVHGVALTSADWVRVLAAGAALVWCPASNMFLFGRTAPMRCLLDATPSAWVHVCLGTDSRVTGARDLLDEMRVATSVSRVTAGELLRMVTTAAATILRLPSAGRLDVGAPADVVVLPPHATDAAAALLATTRRELLLVAIGGAPVVGAPALEPIFAARGVNTSRITVDGSLRVAADTLARGIAASPIAEPGVECRT
jgi:cytosine/adenosine deaminase-related metal-dependent hydrolase